VTLDDLQMRFELARQSIATWPADTAHFVAAASRVRQTSQPDEEVAQAATRTLWAVREEITSLSDASRSTAGKGDELQRGLETALAELGSLDREITQALEQMATVSS
jgi:hypothetical protein